MRSHASNLDKPEEFNNHILEFLQRVGSGVVAKLSADGLPQGVLECPAVVRDVADATCRVGFSAEPHSTITPSQEASLRCRLEAVM